VTVVVTTEEAVVLASHPLHAVQGAAVPSLVQPDQVLPGHALPPHQLVQGPAVQSPEVLEDQGPQPLPGPPGPKGPTPLLPFQPPGPPAPPKPELLPPGPHAPKGAGAPVVWVCQLERAEAYAELEVQAEGQAEPPRKNVLVKVQ
jgi:hypothetical protein